MKTVKVLGHPVHSILIVFPLGLLATAAIFDLIYLATGNATWTNVSMYLIGAGVIGGLLSAVFGIADWIQIPNQTRAKRVGAVHGVGNVIVVLCFIGSWYLRSLSVTPPDSAFVLSFLGVGLAMITGWLGGELVTRLGVGVDEGAHLNAPTSLATGYVDDENDIERRRREGPTRRVG